MLLEKLRLLECSLHGERRNNREWLERLFHPEFLEITRLGVMVDRSKTVTSLFPDVRSGKKQHTIRWREGKIIPGPMLYVNADDDSETLVVQVTEVKTMKLFFVASYLGRLEEWSDEVLLSGMREHYPDIRLDSEVEVIHHLAPG